MGRAGDQGQGIRGRGSGQGIGGREWALGGDVRAAVRDCGAEGCGSRWG